MAIKELWPANTIPPEWITVQSGDQAILAKAARKDIDVVPRIDNFRRLKFEADWFELRTTWEALSWWRKKGSLGE